MVTRRVADEPAFVLHRHDWSESSLVLEVISRHHGRVVLVARGVKKPTSQFRPVLLPLQPLTLNWSGEGEVRGLKAAQWQGGHVMPTGEALVAGSYLNELLLRLLARDDPHPGLFDHYAAAVRLLAEQPAASAPILRAFELVLLRDLGLLPDLGCEGTSLEALRSDGFYQLQPEGGLRVSFRDEPHGLIGRRWLAIHHALHQGPAWSQLILSCAPALGPLRHQLARVLHYHSGVAMFRTRQLMVDVQRLARLPNVEVFPPRSSEASSA